MANILESLTDLLSSAVAGDPPPPVLLDGIAARLGELTSASVDPTGDGIDRWLATLHGITSDTRLHETLLVRVLQVHFPRVAESLTLLGIISFEYELNVPLAFSIDWPQLSRWLSDPGPTSLALLLGDGVRPAKIQKLDDVKALQVLMLMLVTAPQPLLALEYRGQGFAGLPTGGVPGVTSDELLALITSLVNSPVTVALPLVPLPTTLADFTAQAHPGAVGGPQGSITLDGPPDAGYDRLDQLALDVNLTDAGATASKVVPLETWQLTFEAKPGPAHFRIQFAPDHLGAGVRSGGDFGVFLGPQEQSLALLLGEPDGTHFAVGSFRLGLRLRSSGPLFDVVLQLHDIEFALKPDFLTFISFGLDVPDQLQFRSDLDVVYTQGQGLSGQSAGGGPPGLSTSFATPINLKIGGSGAGLTVDQVVTQVDAALQDGRFLFRAQFRYSAKAEFGPLGAVLDGAGVWIGRWSDGNGGLLPPQGIGLTLEAGPVSGGGFLKIINAGEFGGALQVKILGIGAFAYGLYKSLPSGDPSVVVLIGIRLPLPGVQLGFGFAVSGFGGLVGINRRADTDLIRERLASGAAGDVLFNDDPMKNAPKLLGDLQQFFPDQQGTFLVGPTLQVNWLAILKLDLGLFIELPGPTKIFIAGSARLVIGSEEFALVYLRLDFVGGVDFTKSLIFFDAALVNSQVLGIFRITGGVALRIAYGDNGYFLFSVGGFHPSFNPATIELPKVPRVGVSVSLGPVWLKQEMYLAITSNTFQLGSRVEAGIEIGPLSAHGWFGFDALIQFHPFYFIGQIDAGFDVEVSGVSLCSVQVSGQLTGPGPLVLEARASVKLLFVRVSGHVTIELNGSPPETAVGIPDLPDHFRPELTKAENLRMEGVDPSVVFGPVAGGTRLFAPVGELIWEQRRAPLALAMQKVEGVKLDGWHTLVATSTPPQREPETDWFAVGTYLELSDSEALNTSTFCEQQSGLRVLAADLTNGAQTDAEIVLTLYKIPQFSLFAATTSVYVSVGLAQLLGEKAGGAKPAKPAAGVTVTPEVWQTVDATGATTSTDPLNSVQAFTVVQRTGGVAQPATSVALDLTGVL